MKRFFSLLLTAATLVGCLCVVPASAADTDKTLRVGLYYGSTALDEAKLENVDGYAGGYTFGTFSGTIFSSSSQSTGSTQLTMKVASGAIQVSDTATGSILYTAPAGTDLAIRPNSTLTWFKGFKWHGDFCYRIVSGGKLAVINYVNIEDYVKGVLPYEVNADWPSEALKAQAVCARSFAHGTNKHASDGFELCNTTNCQVYKGANLATANSDAAVDATRGEILSYNGEPVIGYFFSSDGGATEDAVNVWGGDYPYLKGKVDPYEDVENAYNGVWSVTLTAAQIKDKLAAAGHSIGTVASVAVTKRTNTDNVNEVTVTDTSGKQVKITRDAVRTVFGLNSIRYTITPNKSGVAKAAQFQRTADQIGLSTHAVAVDQKTVAPQGYNVNGSNYYKLRDLAYVLNGSKTQFNVIWDAAGNRILLESNTAYQAVGGEMTASASAKIENFSPSESAIVLDGKAVSLTGYRINGNNYYRVRDVGAALGFGVDFDDETDTVLIDSAGASDPAPDPVVTGAASYTFNGTGWGHSVGMSQYGALGMAKKGFTYEEILKFYFTGISIAR